MHRILGQRSIKERSDLVDMNPEVAEIKNEYMHSNIIKKLLKWDILVETSVLAIAIKMELGLMRLKMRHMDR
ncbi:324_t:CDS:2 [Dentiscutata heterogama]|uniref:324_t:CDS:1 n=1 Tax=Dentiscutata heterogama TaxID=1316150 RepID=A0ACA9KNS5_9GLOM|nr:324_t:CDS:2 [Dentiscutata heterogama]